MLKKTAMAHNAPDEAGADAEPQEVLLELAGNEAVGGADEVQHLDDLAIGGHGAARRRDDDRGGGGGDQQQDRQSAEREGARHRADLALPAAMVVERGAGKLLGEIGLERVDVRLGLAVHLDGDEARHGQLAQRIGLAEPRLEQRGRVVER